MKEHRTSIALGVVVLALVVGGGIYISNISGDLARTRVELGAATREAKSAQLALSHAQKRTDEITAERDKLQDRLTAVPKTAKQDTEKLAQALKRVGTLDSQLSEARDEARETRQIADYWRDLFDYAKARWQRIGAAACPPVSQSLKTAQVSP